MRPIESVPELALVPAAEVLDIPLDLSDIIAICREYSRLGHQMQQQAELITELGMNDAIKTKQISLSSLPHIKSFFQQVIRNPYFGDAVDQAAATVRMIEDWQETHPITLTN